MEILNNYPQVALKINQTLSKRLRQANARIKILNGANSYAYSENDFLFVQQLADQLAVCINNARLFAEVSKSKREWEETFKAVPDKLFLIDLSYNVLRCNNLDDFLKIEENGINKCYHLFACCGDQCQLCPTVEAFKTDKPTVREVIHRYDERGKQLHDSIHKYMLLTAEDAPEINAIIVEANDPTGPFGAKGVGETGLVPTAGAIANAVYNAMGIRFKEIPLTEEKVFKALQERG